MERAAHAFLMNLQELIALKSLFCSYFPMCFFLQSMCRNPSFIYMNLGFFCMPFLGGHLLLFLHFLPKDNHFMASSACVSRFYAVGLLFEFLMDQSFFPPYHFPHALYYIFITVETATTGSSGYLFRDFYWVLNKYACHWGSLAGFLSFFYGNHASS